MEKRFEVALPEELLAGFGWPDSEVTGGVREALVMELVRLDRLSEARAAAILGLSRWELLEAMSRHEVPAVRMPAEELKQELAKEARRSTRSPRTTGSMPIW